MSCVAGLVVSLVLWVMRGGEVHSFIRRNRIGAFLKSCLYLACMRVFFVPKSPFHAVTLHVAATTKHSWCLGGVAC